MKTLYTLYIICAVVFFALSETLSAQQSQQKIEMRIDSIGNAKINISMQMNAQQWQNWIATLGNNPAALKRAVERSMPAYFLDDFKLDKDEMNRSFNLSLNAYGVCEIDKRGTWSIDTDQESAQLTELDEHKYMFVSSPPEWGGQVQQTYLINLPETATNVKVDKNAFGRDIFKFDMEAPAQAGLGGAMRWGGILLLVVGMIWSIKNVLMGKKAAI